MRLIIPASPYVDGRRHRRTVESGPGRKTFGTTKGATITQRDADPLIAFLQARIDEDEALTRAAMEAEPFYSRFGDAVAEAAELATSEGAREEAGAYIEHYEPARMLRECEAKRRILELVYEDFSTSGDRFDEGVYVGGAIVQTDVLLILAQPYADHPDYRPEWRH